MKSLRSGGRSDRGAGEIPAALSGKADEDIQKYMNMDDDTRWQLLVRKVTESKRAGNMSDADLDAFAVSARAMLEPAQYQRLISLIAVLKNG